MKKLFFSIFMFLGIAYSVSAKEIYYSDYGEFSEYSIGKIESSELINVEVERRYKFYSEEKKGEYRSFLDDNSSFKFVDKDKIKNSKFSSWSEEAPSEVEGRITESKTLYLVKRPKPIRNIYITNTGDTDIILGKIEIYFENEKVSYEVSHNFTSGNYTIHSGGHIKLDLKGYYDLQNITIKISEAIFDETNELHLSATVPSEDNSYQISYFRVNLDNSYNRNIVIEASDWIRTNTKYEEEVILNYRPNAPLSLINKKVYYRYLDPLFYFYNIDKEYKDGYFKECPGLIKDESNFLDFYRFQTRNKFEISETIEINGYNQDLSSFVNSTVDYSVKTNLNIYQNGIYDAEFITDFVTVKKQVLVNIKENLIDDLNDKYIELEQDLNETNKKYEDSLKELNNLKLKNDYLILKKKKLKKDNNHLNQNIDSLLNDNRLLKQNILEKELECKTCQNELKSNLSKNKSVVSLDKSNLFCLWLIILIIFLLILILLKKLSDKNKF